MAQITDIQWCDSTVNPVMGCDGCELWPTNASLKRRMVEALMSQFPSAIENDLRDIVEKAMGHDVPSLLWRNRRTIIGTMVTELSLCLKGVI